MSPLLIGLWLGVGIMMIIMDIKRNKNPHWTGYFILTMAVIMLFRQYQ